MFCFCQAKEGVIPFGQDVSSSYTTVSMRFFFGKVSYLRDFVVFSGGVGSLVT